MKLSPLTPDFVRANDGEGIRFSDMQWEDRALVVRKYLALEALLLDRVMESLVALNPGVDVHAARDELLVDGPLGSAPKMALFLYHAGRLDRALFDDIRSICKLRHRYAHDHGRGQLRDEPQLMAFLTNTNTYKQGRELLLSTNEQGVLVCIFARLMTDLGRSSAA